MAYLVRKLPVQVRIVGDPRAKTCLIDAKRISLTPGARIELERLTLPLPDDGGAAHREKPGLLFQRLARLETRGTKHRHCRAVFLVAHRFVAYRIDILAARDAGEVLGRTVIGRVSPYGAGSQERRARQIDQARVYACAKDGLRRRPDVIEPLAVGQEAPAPESELGAGGALCLGAVPNAEIGRRAESRTDGRGIAEGRRQQVVQAVRLGRQRWLALIQQPLEH